MRFAVVADVHIPSRAARADAFVKAIVANPSIEFVISAGDLTDNGYDGKLTCSCFGRLFPAPNLLVGGGVENQLAEYISRFDAPLRAAGKLVFAMPGNTDKCNGGRRYPVDAFLRERHGGTHYIVVRGGVALVFCDVYPNATVLEWFARAIHTQALQNLPFAFFFHYNLEDASFGTDTDDWTSAEKRAFRNAINNLHVLGIFVGHIHASYTYKWNRHNVYCTGGDSWALVDLVTDASGITSCQVAFATAADGKPEVGKS